MTPVRRRRFVQCKAVLWLAVLALLFLAPAFPVGAQDATRATVAEYLAALEQARDQIAAATGKDAQAAVYQAFTHLAAIAVVEYPDGNRVRPAPLFTPEDTKERALARLDAVIAQLKAAEGEDAAARLASLDRVLASDQMNQGSGLLDWLLLLLARLLGRTSGDAVNQGFNLLDTLLTIVGAAVLVFILGRILQAALGNFLKEADVRREGVNGERLTVVGARRRATELAQAGSYREAVRQLYLATLLSLEDRGLLRIDRSLTNREVLQSVGRWAEVQGGLRPVVDTFETVWYGEREPDRETFERYSTEVETAADLIERASPLAAGAPLLVGPPSASSAKEAA